MECKVCKADFGIEATYLANISFSSCSETNCPKLATNNVEHGALAEIGWLGGWVAPVEPTGLQVFSHFEIKILSELHSSRLPTLLMLDSVKNDRSRGLLMRPTNASLMDDVSALSVAVVDGDGVVVVADVVAENKRWRKIN